MASRTKVYFVSDVHIGLDLGDPSEREARFLRFLKDLPRDTTAALYLLGDIWDFWYEYRDVVPKTGTRVVAQLIDLMDSGVEVYFCAGNHDIWTYSFFEEIGIHKITQPYVTVIGGHRFCLGHGDLLGGAKWSYKFMLDVFRCRPIQVVFSLLHPYLAYRLGNHWSHSNRRKHKPYTFRGADEPLYKFSTSFASSAASSGAPIDFFVFGHFHDRVDLTLPSGSRLVIIKDWVGGGTPYVEYDIASGELVSHYSRQPR